MSTVYIDQQGAKLHHCGEEVHIEKDGETLAKLPLARIDRIVLAGSVQLSTQVMELFLKHHIPVSFTSTHGRYKGRLTPPLHKNVALRLEQYHKYHDDGFRLRQASVIIGAKIRNCHELVQKHMRSHKELDCSHEIQSMAREMSGVKSAVCRDSLMGHEGTAARHYFTAFGKMVRREFVFEKRTRRPPKDPVNALLSLGYTLLFNEMVTALEAIGLDPYLGFLHEIDYGRASLAADLCEEFRFLVDALALSLVNRGELKRENFTYLEDGGVHLDDTGRKLFYASYEHKVRTEIEWCGVSVSYRRLFFNQAELLARVVKGEAAEYIPLLMR